ncbi:MAG: tripartite tricarboxylate transporter substrate-binding protein [Gammaproteobacteria bacterium]|nr:tripartite tricarboxylate transporter substrate-binding protein [Gammaproteobacteria bacterium]
MILAISAVALAAASGAWAQKNYPTRPVRIVIPFPPGGNVDVFGRVLYRQVESELGRSIVIDNRGGANGILGADIVAKATPDGYTMLNVSFSFAVNPAIRKKMPFNVERDFLPVTNVAIGLGYLMVVNPNVPVKNIPELIALAKQKEVTYSTAGVGNGQHLAGALFEQKAGVKMLMVPYRGGGPAATAAIGGEVMLHYPAPSVGVPHVKAGRLRAVGFTGAKRLEALPDVQTVGETIVGFVSDSGWHAVFAPAGTPMAVATRMQQAIHKALQVPSVRKHFVSNGYIPQADPPAVWAKKFKAELKRYDEAARLARIERF